MNWKNLLKNLCPKCDEDLAGSFVTETRTFVCVCGFKITERRLREVTTDMAEQKLEEEKYADLA